MGIGRCEPGATMACFYVWAWAVRDAAPALLIIENAPRLPVILARSILEDMYTVD